MAADGETAPVQTMTSIRYESKGKPTTISCDGAFTPGRSNSETALQG